MGRKRAVLVGINYAGTQGELKGCLNDVSRMRRCLVDRFGFDEADIRVLADADPSTPQPTGANIRTDIVEMLRARTGKDDIGVGSIRTTLLHHFGDDASPKIRRLVNAMLGHRRHGGETVDTKQEVEAEARMPRNGMLISGCQTDETSADATTPEGVSYGALSNAIQAVLAEEERGGKGKVITSVELVRRARELLAKEGYTQQPGLYCSDKHANVAFICSNH